MEGEQHPLLRGASQGLRLEPRQAGTRIQDGSPLNIGAFCSDRICDAGSRAEDRDDLGRFDGEERRYTFDDLRIHSNAFTTLLRQIGIGAGDRGLPLHGQGPRALHLLPRDPQERVRSPSRSSPPSARTRSSRASTTRRPRRSSRRKKHVKKVRRIRDSFPSLRHIIVVDGEADEAQGRRDRLRLRRRPRASRRARLAPRRRRDAVGPPLHVRARRASPRAPCTSTARSSRSTSRRSGCSTSPRTTSTGARPTRAGSPGPRTGSSGRGATA